MLTREKAEILKVASNLFKDNTLIGVVRTGNGKEEQGHCFIVVNRNNGVALGISNKGLEIFKLTGVQIAAMRQNGDLEDPHILGRSLIVPS